MEKLAGTGLAAGLVRSTQCETNKIETGGTRKHLQNTNIHKRNHTSTIFNANTGGSELLAQSEEIILWYYEHL